jgi:hypothetical protein
MTTSKGECRATISSDLSGGAFGRVISQTSRVKKCVDNGVATASSPVDLSRLLTSRVFFGALV